MTNQSIQQDKMLARLDSKLSTLIDARSGPDIFVNNDPKGNLKITQTMIEDFLLNPTLGIYCIFGEELDVFQSVRAKLSWYCPRVIDSSGLSSGKSLNMFWTFNLRCILMEGRIAGVYYPSWSQGQKIFWKYYPIYFRKSAIFRAQVGRMNADQSKVEGKAQVMGTSCWSMEYRNGSQILMPAGSFATDSKTQAGLRLNDLGIDEINKIAATGSTGIDDQLIGRCTIKTFNKAHPIWQNHQLFLSTAEDTMHPGYERYKSFKKKEESGDPHFSTFSFCFKDYSDQLGADGQPFTVHREDTIMADLQMNKSPSSYMQEALGIWSANGKAFYAQEYIDNAFTSGRERNVQVVTGRESDQYAKTKPCYYFMGIDPAPAQKNKADDGAIVVLRASPRGDTESEDPRDWNLDWVWAYRVRNADAAQWAAIIHRKELSFGFAGLMMDPGGGGQWVRLELKKGIQKISGTDTPVTPIAIPEEEEEFYVQAKFTLSMFRMMDPAIQSKWGTMQLINQDGLYDKVHSEFQEAWLLGCFGLPRPAKDVPKEEFETWSAEKVSALDLIQTMARQITSINVKTDEFGGTKFSKNGAKQFICKGRKDFAYAGMYAHVKFLTWLKAHGDEFVIPEEDAAMCG